jgi:adenylate kinase family enzyme
MKSKKTNLINTTHHRMNWFQQFLVICSGSNVHILKKTPSEWNKFAGIGGIVLFTAVFATLSAGYAMFTIFDDIWASVGFAILWGLMIFNLDRYIVSSIKKTGTWWNQILMAIPRLILATFLGIIISKPLELKIFEKEVNKQLNTIIQRNKTKLQAEMNGRIMQQSGPFDTEKKQIQAKTIAYQKSYDSAAVELEKEILGKQSSLTSGKVGYGTNAKRKAELKEQRRQDLENYQKQIAPRLEYLDKEVSKVYTNIEKERDKTEIFEDQFNGFAARLQALDELGKNSAIIGVAAAFIMGLFITLEISPVLIKLISSVGPYDYLLEKTENDFRLYSKEKIEKGNAETDWRIDDFKEKLGKENEKL